LATVCSKEVAWQKQLILPTFRANQIFLTDKCSLIKSESVFSIQIFESKNKKKKKREKN